MFTGIVEETGQVVSLVQTARAWRLVLRASMVLEDLKIGDSLAVNGCCLTVAAIRPEASELQFDLLEETLKRTSFRILAEGRRVNLERSLLPTTRMGGHFVSGHIDATGEVGSIARVGADTVMEVVPPAEFLRYLVYKGCIAVDGVSLTVAEVKPDRFLLWLIPHTLEVTNLGERARGDPVNLEFDLLAKYVERQAAWNTR